MSSAQGPLTEKSIAEFEAWLRLEPEVKITHVLSVAPRLVKDLRAARAALRLWSEAINHRDECEACEWPGPDPCPTYDDLSSKAVLARDAALPPEDRP